MFVRNCWYMAGWSRDFARDELKAVTMLNEQIVIYRKNDGGLVALQDRCCHRFAPLSLGRIENDDLRCMYHGLKFAPSGKCIEIPGQSKIPPQACVRAYPIVDKYSGAWVWMGDPALADVSLIPDFVGIDDPRWAMLPGRMDYNANYMLINDNLLDLSHIPFLHRYSLGASLTPEGVSRPTVTRLERSVKIQNWLKAESSQMIGSIRGMRTEIWQTYDFVAPGVFLLRADFYPLGTAARFPGARAVRRRAASSTVHLPGGYSADGRSDLLFLRVRTVATRSGVDGALLPTWPEGIQRRPNDDRSATGEHQSVARRRDAHDRVGQRLVPVQKNDGQDDEG